MLVHDLLDSFTTMFFCTLKDPQYGLKVKYEILEASEGTGGRPFTHTFSAREGRPAIGPHDSYDGGAMRFLAINIMKR